MNREQLEKKLKGIHQEFILNQWNSFDPQQQKLLAHQIETLNITTYEEQKKLLHSEPHRDITFEPYQDYTHSGSTENQEIGEKIIGDGNLGCIIIAGGQGTRLKFEGPKGLFPVSVIKNKSLYQLFAEKTLAASKRYQKKLHIALMTSSQNHDVTVAYFKKNEYFGLDEDQVDFFTQENLPFLDEKGNLLLEKPNKIAEGPDGNGYTLHKFLESKIWEKWYANDIRFINIVLIDNPLADPFDAELVGYHYRKGTDITIKCVTRKNANEKVGLLVGNPSHLQVVEYSEMPQEEQNAKLPNGTLKHQCANISLFCLNMEFAQYISEKTLPLHKAYKPVKLFNNPQTHAWKYERYIFDILLHTRKISTIMFPREQTFSPLKNFEGDFSPSTVRKDLLHQDREIISSITGLPAPKHDFELSQDFHYPTKEIFEFWMGKAPPETPYINAF